MAEFKQETRTRPRDLLPKPIHAETAFALHYVMKKNDAAL